MPDYDALLVLSFGGPEHPDDVVPFLERVTAGRGIPRERLEAVGEHYHLFGGVSPINAQNLGLIELIKPRLAAAGIDLPVYCGNRNWHPLLADTMEHMRRDGVRRALVFVTSAFSSYSGCRQYREDLARAQAAVGNGAPEVHKLRVFYNHPRFIATQAHRLRAALHGVPQERRGGARLVFTAHSIPTAMAETSDYEAQLAEAAQLVVTEAGLNGHDHDLVYQSRSGPPQVPWLEPDIGDHLRTLAASGARDVVVVPIGFLTDHMEVLFDLDVEARAVAAEHGIHLSRAGTVGPDPAIAQMVVELVQERLTPSAPRVALGRRGPAADWCPSDCCPNLRHPDTPAAAEAPAQP